ncbi:MAG: hypothetical protein GC159_12220 [Phycisphaera sp.]|nr:hypothetical protein [Phycisphaera sp.]
MLTLYKRPQTVPQTLLTVFLFTLAVYLSAATPVAQAADPAPTRGEGLRKLIERFDKDGDGRLNAEERAEARKLIQQFKPAAEPPVPAKIDPKTTKLYKPAAGPLAIEAVDTLVLHDAKRDKDLQLRLTFPKTGGPYPLIVFSHGATGSKDGYQPLATYWASHGYVVIQPTHGDSLSLMSDEDKRKMTSVKQLLNSSNINREWDDRPADVKLVLDSLDEIETKAPALAKRIDRQHIAMAGHSYGAHTSMLIAGMSMVNPIIKSQRMTLRDDRPQCFVFISPQGTGTTIDTESWDKIDRPVLMITGSNDTDPRGGKPASWRMEVWDHLPPKPGDKVLLYINDAYHNMGGISGAHFPGAGPDTPDHVLLVQSTTLAWFDANLKADPAAKAYMNSDTVKAESQGEAYVKHKTEK